jgi:2-dehydro-3-deoxyglucarate aldolase/4-hydroxy-2-oxoheptanedioate aldolase
MKRALTTTLIVLFVSMNAGLFYAADNDESLPSKTSFKTRLKNNEILKGTFITFLQGPDVVQFLKGKGGLDFFILDTEHGSYDVTEVREMILAARCSGICSLIRIMEPGHYESLVLDMGADGIVIPLVETREQAEQLVKYGRYKPQGNRGISSVNGHNNFSGAKDLPQFITDRNRDVLLFVMIETEKAVENRDEILSTPGIDGCILGTGDLSMDMGYAGQPDHPAVAEASMKVIETCRSKNLIVSIPIRKPEHVEKWVKSGMNMLTFGSDVSLLGAGTNLFQNALKEALKSNTKAQCSTK